MLPERKKNRLQTLRFFFFFATSFISISFLKPHLASWSSNLPSRRTLQGRKKGEKTTGGMAKGQLDQDAYIIYSLPSLLLLEELCFFLLLLLPSSLPSLSVQYVKTRSEKFASSQSPAIISLSSGVQ